MKTLKILSSIFIPPLGVFLQKGIGSAFWINIPLTALGIIPGAIHAIWCLEGEKATFPLDRWVSRI